jgi:hypothetical protein
VLLRNQLKCQKGFATARFLARKKAELGKQENRKKCVSSFLLSCFPYSLWLLTAAGIAGVAEESNEMSERFATARFFARKKAELGKQESRKKCVSSFLLSCFPYSLWLLGRGSNE